MMTPMTNSFTIGPMTEGESILAIILIIIAILTLVVLIVLVMKNNKKEEEQLRQQSIVIKYLTEEVEELKKAVKDNCANCGSTTRTIKKTITTKPASKTTVVKKEQPVKKEETALTDDQIAKRDAKRAALARKAAEAAQGKKLTAAQLRKFKLTDLYGVAEKRAHYYATNGREDIVKLSKMPNSALTDKFIDEFPALKSWTREDKLKAIAANIEEAKFMVESLTK